MQKIFILQFVVLQALLASVVGALWFMGYAQIPFQDNSWILCTTVLSFAGIGLVMIAAQKWDHASWIASMTLRLGLMGTIIGLIVTLHAAVAGGKDAIVHGMLLAMYVTFMGISSNIYLKINLHLLGP